MVQGQHISKAKQKWSVWFKDRSEGARQQEVRRGPWRLSVNGSVVEEGSDGASSLLWHHLHGVHTLSRQLEGREEEVGEREEGGSSGRERSTMGAESCCCASNFHGEPWDRP